MEKEKSAHCIKWSMFTSYRRQIILRSSVKLHLNSLLPPNSAYRSGFMTANSSLWCTVFKVLRIKKSMFHFTSKTTRFAYPWAHMSGSSKEALGASIDFKVSRRGTRPISETINERTLMNILKWLIKSLEQ
jgi:hypothetical protein